MDSEYLANRLDSFQQAYNSRADQDLVTLFNNGVEALKKSPFLNEALTVGDKAPDFKLANALNQPVLLASFLKKGPVVLTWYRGGWCPYCNIQLRYLQNFLPQFKTLGANLIAISPELPDKSLSTKEKNALGFEVLSDFNNEIARKFGIVYKLDGELAGVYNHFNKLEIHNGVNTSELPVPATYVIGQDFIIRYAFIDVDYRKRAEPENILEILKKM